MALAAILFILLGGLVAADARLPAALTTTLAAASGGVLDAVNRAALSQSGLVGSALVGTATVIFVVIAIGASQVISLRAAWARIAVRVAGSWIAATGILLLGWSLRRQ